MTFTRNDAQEVQKQVLARQENARKETVEEIMATTPSRAEVELRFRQAIEYAPTNRMHYVNVVTYHLSAKKDVKENQWGFLRDDIARALRAKYKPYFPDCEMHENGRIAQGEIAFYLELTL